MTFDSNDVLRRFHRALVREIQASNPEHLSAPFSVAEIYQNLVPYRTHRDEIGVEMNADYEHALLRLLAGESDFLTIESRTARQEIREELESPNPNTGLYRDFAAADVRLNPEKIDEALMWEPDPAGGAPEGGVPEDFPAVESTAMEVFIETSIDASEEDPVFSAEDEKSAEIGMKEDDAGAEEESMESEELMGEEIEEEAGPSGEEDVTVEEAPEVDPEEVLVEFSDDDVDLDSEKDDEMAEDLSGVSPDLVEESPPTTCAWCKEALPQRSGVNFCPFCGCSVHLVPCPECGEELELNWRFCIACGTEVSS